MKVQSFYAGVYSSCKNAGWAEETFKALDNQVRKVLGDDVVIHSVSDHMYVPANGADPAMVRVVVYDNKR